MSFSLDDVADKEIIDYLNTLKNKSAYIADLIRADRRRKGTFSEAQKEEIRDIIREFIREGNEISADVDSSDKEEQFDPDALSALDMFNS